MHICTKGGSITPERRTPPPERRCEDVEPCEVHLHERKRDETMIIDFTLKALTAPPPSSSFVDEELQELKVHPLTVRELDVCDLNEIAGPCVPVQLAHEQDVNVCVEEESKLTRLVLRSCPSQFCSHSFD